MKNALMYGAGNIGRGFIGQLFHMSGYEISFIDVNMTVIDKLNNDGQYPIYITEGEGYSEYLVTGVHGVNGRDNEAIAEAMAAADIMATAVGVNILKFIAAPFAAGVRRRMEKGIRAPLNVIICENMIEADKYFAALVKENLNEAEREYFDTHIALVEPSIGRMVPATPKEIAEKNPLAVCVEPYCELPVDKNAFLGEIPSLRQLSVKRKLTSLKAGSDTAAGACVLALVTLACCFSVSGTRSSALAVSLGYGTLLGRKFMELHFISSFQFRLNGFNLNKV